MNAGWKQVERMVAAVLGGVRSWDTDHDVLIPVVAPWTRTPGNVTGNALLNLSEMKLVTLASVEVKNLTAPTIAQIETFLVKNRQKADRDGVKFSALVVKRKAGAGKKTMALLIVPLEEYRDVA